MKLSVVIPVYNVEKYLDKCVESIVNQTFKDLEIILVDDGSTDGLFHIVTQAGIVGAILYFCAVYAGIKKAKDDHTLRSYGLYMYIYGMLVGSAIEINLSTAFLLGVAVIYRAQPEAIST